MRGCIGTFEAQPLSKLLPKYVKISAFQDTRFDPISLDEVEDLHLGLSLLYNHAKGKKWDQWEVGKHGIIIEFEHKGREYSGTFLPEVAQEQNWDQKETLKYLIRKAGFRGDYKEVLDKIELTTYESYKRNMSYAEYAKIRGI